MARLNTRPSSRYASETPGASTSDQENHDPRARPMDKGKGRAIDAPSRASLLPTPASDGLHDARGQKRKRTTPRQSESSANTELEDEEDEEDDEDTREAAKFVKYFDPNQNPEVRREIKRKSRALEREFHENRDDLLRDTGRGLTRTIDKANRIYSKVKQTNDATLDSRLLANISDMAYKKSAQMVIGDNANGIDVDEFLSKCITYMRNGGPLDHSSPPTSSRRRPAHHNDSDDEDADDDLLGGDDLDWAVLGRHACFPYNSRPPVPSFLLGPLSVQKKHRATQRRAPQTKDNARESRPEALSRDQLSSSDETTLTAICKRINAHLRKHVERAERTLQQAGFTHVSELASARGKAMLKQLRQTETGGPSLFEYVLNPRSFGQTVENLFYVSFLIKEGMFGVVPDADGLPTIVPSQPSTLEQQRRNKTSKHQAVFSIDYATWEQLIEAFEVQEPLIEHRAEDDEARAARMGERGWYS